MLALRNYNIDELRRLDVAHHLPAQTDYGLQERNGGSRIIVRADGCVLTDGEGNQILDGMAGLWCVNIGYGRTELADVAREQMLELPYYNTFFKTANAPAITLAAKVASLLGPPLNHVFFNSSGSEAIDTVIRMVRRYWQLMDQPERTVMIARRNGYHGSTIGGVSLGGMGPMRNQGGPWVPDIVHIRQPYHFGEGFGEDPAAFGQACVQALEDEILKIGPERVAAFVGEPVQGAGGVIIPPEGYWKGIEAVCRKYGILMVCDEVICGFGRTGQWFGFQHYGVQPDLVSMAKGLSSAYLPISAVGVADHIVDVFREKGKDFVHGYTYSGHPTAAAVALKNLEIMERESLPARVREDVGPYLAKALATLDDHPLVGETRSLGLLGAVEIVSAKGTNQRFGGEEGNAGPVVRDFCVDNGLMVRAIRDTIVTCPPLIISHAEIDQLVGILRGALDKAEATLRARYG